MQVFEVESKSDPGGQLSRQDPLKRIPLLHWRHFPVELSTLDHTVHLLSDVGAVTSDHLVHIDKVLLESYLHAAQPGIAAAH